MILAFFVPEDLCWQIHLLKRGPPSTFPICAKWKNCTLHRKSDMLAVIEQFSSVYVNAWTILLWNKDDFEVILPPMIHNIPGKSPLSLTNFLLFFQLKITFCRRRFLVQFLDKIHYFALSWFIFQAFVPNLSIDDKSLHQVISSCQKCNW